MLWVYRFLAITLVISRCMIIYENIQRIKERKKFKRYDNSRRESDEY